MYFSDHFGIQPSVADDWFDPILNADTKVFVDPFLIFAEGVGDWAGCHAELLEHFNLCYQLVAKAGGTKTLPYKSAMALLRSPEPREFCLGYTAKGVNGSGSGPGLGAEIIKAMQAVIKLGLDDLDHFELLGILNEGIGADRISDLTCNILRGRFISYTQGVAKAHSIPLEPHSLPVLETVAGTRRYATQVHSLPTNPFSSGPVLLTPKRFLRELPTLNATDWWESSLNADLRTQLNTEIQGKVTKKKIVELARKNPDRVRSWVQAASPAAATPYDLDTDPAGLYQWDRHASEYATANPLSLSASTWAQLEDCIDRIVTEFRHFVEDQGGWKLLWDKHDEKHEEAAQLLFRGLASSYCHQSDVVIDREVDLGCGSVDFKFSSGYTRTVHLEVKKLHNGKFWNGLELQLPKYMSSDGTRRGWFIALWEREGGVSEERLKELPDRVKKIAKAKGLKLRFGVVDARRQVSASKLKD